MSKGESTPSSRHGSAQEVGGQNTSLKVQEDSVAIHMAWLGNRYGVYGCDESGNEILTWYMWAVDVHVGEWAGVSGGGHVLFDVVSFSTDLCLNVGPRSHGGGMKSKS